MGAFFDDCAFFQDVNAVGILDGGKPVRDDECRAILHEAIERFLNLALCFRVHGSRCLVEKEDGRVF